MLPSTFPSLASPRGSLSHLLPPALLGASDCADRRRSAESVERGIMEVELTGEQMALRFFELRLLRCTLPLVQLSDSAVINGVPDQKNAAASGQLHTLDVLISNMVSLIESGKYVEALASSDVSLSVFELDANSFYGNDVESADHFYAGLVEHVDLFFKSKSSIDDALYRAFLVMTIAVAALLAFVQCNVTGPIEALPPCPLPLRVLQSLEWENWARNQIMSAGSDLLGKFTNLQYLVFAKMLLTRTKDFLFGETVESPFGIRTISWWLARINLIQQKIMDEHSSSLFDSLQVLFKETLDLFGTKEKVRSYWGAKYIHEEEASTMTAMLYLEAGIMEQTYSRLDKCRLHFRSAELESGLELAVTGVLGMRTMHQEEAKAQLVLVTNSNSALIDSQGLSQDSSDQLVQSNGHDTLQVHQSKMLEVSDVLMTPKLVACGNSKVKGGQNGSKSLKPIQQAVVLAQCLLIEKSTRNDEMQRWDMAPYIEAIDLQEYSPFIIRCFCDILRIRWESTRSRTKERALLMMEELVRNICESSSGVADRITICFGASILTIPALRKEYGELLVRCGLLGEALKVFENLELWDNLIYCYCLLEKKSAAVDLINARLSVTPHDPRLWCSLGDVTNDDYCFEKALEVSNNKSARAKRSLARSAYERGDYEKSKVLWESAMAMNSLHPGGWFSLGAAALKARDIEKALDGFTCAVQLDPENGEAWNNIACLHMIKKKNKEACIAFKEALKFKRNSWQLWENYAQVSVDVGNLAQALEAVQMVLELTNNKRADVAVLESVMLEIEKSTSTRQFTSEELNDPSQPSNAINESANTDHLIPSSREIENLQELIRKVLHRIIRSGGGDAAVWGLYARWHKLKGDLTMCAEALQKQIRSYQGSDVFKEIERFKKFADASLKLCKVYTEIFLSTGQNELKSAEMHLNNVIKQAVDFSDTDEYRSLQSCLDEVKNLQQVTSPSC
uniref:Tetratricopeptide repeat protein 27 homolog n=1 Tax=Kalanchoe fedtschenkoi TaxID=63787 RepID=A0A7N0TWB7_KALFE